MSHRLNIAPGYRFGRFVVVEEVAPKDKYKRRNMLVRCGCGTEKTVHLTNLVSGKTTSCGCASARPRRTDEPPAVAGCRWVAVYPDRWALVDEENYAKASSVLWRKHKRYASTWTTTNTERGSSVVLMHRFLFGDLLPAGLVVDHMNGDGLDNRRANIRFVTLQQNKFNSKPKANKRSKGVYQNKGYWQAQIQINGVRHYLGQFKSEIDAARAYNQAAKKFFGEYAWLNVLDETKDTNDDTH